MASEVLDNEPPTILARRSRRKLGRADESARASASFLKSIDFTAGEPDRTAEAIGRVLPDLAKLDRYERRASRRRDRAVGELIRENNQ
jgi:hypothetical protein